MNDQSLVIKVIHMTYISCLLESVTILVYDAYFLSVQIPLHVGDNTLISIVDHFLMPHTVIQDPYNNQAIAVGCGKFLMMLVPRRDQN